MKCKTWNPKADLLAINGYSQIIEKFAFAQIRRILKYLQLKLWPIAPGPVLDLHIHQSIDLHRFPLAAIRIHGALHLGLQAQRQLITSLLIDRSEHAEPAAGSLLGLFELWIPELIEAFRAASTLFGVAHG